jgi:hypothetical protein
VRAPRGRGGSRGAFLRLGGKKLARSGRDLCALGLSGQPRGRSLHDHAEGIRSLRLQLVNDLPDLSLDLIDAHGCRQICSQQSHLRLFATGGLLTTRFAVDVDRLFAPLHLFTHNSHQEVIVDLPAGGGILARLHQLALEKLECVQCDTVAATARIDQLGLQTVVQCHGGDCHIGGGAKDPVGTSSRTYQSGVRTSARQSPIIGPTMSPLFLVGPFAIVIGVVSVFFVMRHKSVQTRSMYSSRRSNLERKVRAARTRTLGPDKHDEVAHAGGPPKLTYEPSAFAGPPVAPPSAPVGAPNQSWDVGPTAAPPSPPAAEPPPAPPYVPPPPVPPPSEREPIWTPSPPEPTPAAQQRPEPPAPVEVPAGAGASWSIVGGEKKDAAIADGDGKKKKKKGKLDPQAAAWQLASGEAPGDEGENEPDKPSATLAIAQYAVLVVGLVMVLIGVLVVIANSHVT